jgi:Bacterial Ig-like domain (group 1)
MRSGWLALGFVVLVSVAIGHWGCEVPPLMAPGSTIVLIANPEFIVANGGVSVITAIVSEPAGTFVPDGSVVLFFTNLGRIDPQGKTVDGVARVNLVADSRSGRATVTGVAAGGGGPVPSGVTGGGEGSDSQEVMIGSALPRSVVLTANPPTIRGGGSSTIIANVFDEFGNPVANVPVIFSVSGLLGASLESGGSQKFTDTNGQAFDTLRTRAVGTTGTATVAVNLPGGSVAGRLITVQIPVTP